MGRAFNPHGGNGLIPAPVVRLAAERSVSGTTCPGCTMEIYSDAEDEGCIYEGTTVADGMGHFTFAKNGSLSGPYITATATDGEGNTSEFSLPALLRMPVYLPLVVKP
jgi:hypothetical protein